jgi:hypothetical protein
MPRSVTIVLALVALIAIGCAHKEPPSSPPPTAPPATPQQVDALRAAYRSQHSDSELGVISDARPQDRLVAVTGLNANAIQPDQVVTFIDSTQTVLATGRVIRIVGNEVHARYDPPTGPHAPGVGDLMVRF